MERTQEEVIKIFEEKQYNAEREIERVRARDCELTPLEKDTKTIKNKAYMEAYEDCIAFLRGCTIVEPKSLCDTCNASRDKYGICFWIKGEGIKASQCGHYSKKDTGKAEALGVSEPTCEKPVLCDTCKLKNEKFMPSCLSHNTTKCFAYKKEETNESMIPKADITKDKLEGVWVLYSGVITEKDGNVYIDDGTKVYCFPKYSTTRYKDLKYYYQEKKPNQIVGVDDQFREFVDNLGATNFVNAKNVSSIVLRTNKQYDGCKYFVDIYLTYGVMVLRFETEQEQLDKYNELKEWLKKWNQ